MGNYCDLCDRWTDSTHSVWVDGVKDCQNVCSACNNILNNDSTAVIANWFLKILVNRLRNIRLSIK